MTPRQREISDRIAGKRGQTRGPFLVWLQSPELCDKVEALGAYARFDSSLDLRLRELILLIAARHFEAQYSWNAHVDKAIDAGISHQALQTLAAGGDPDFGDPEAQAIYAFCIEVLREHFIADATFDRALTMFGPQTLVDAIGSLGNFSMLAMCLNAFEVDLQADRTPPFPEIRGYDRVAPGS